MHRVFCIFYFSIAVSCSNGKTSILSEPSGAEVWLHPSRGEKTSLGQTPLEIATSSLSHSDGEFANILVEKEGFIPNGLMLPMVNDNHIYEIKLTLKSLKSWVNEHPNLTDCLIKSEREKNNQRIGKIISEFSSKSICAQFSGNKLQRLAKGIAHSQSLIVKKSFDEAKTTLETLSTEFPQVSVIYDLRANIAYIQKNYRSALIYYRKSMIIDPTNLQTQKMVDRINQLNPNNSIGDP